jgi:hypothetical protein
MSTPLLRGGEVNNMKQADSREKRPWGKSVARRLEEKVKKGNEQIACVCFELPGLTVLLPTSTPGNRIFSEILREDNDS